VAPLGPARRSAAAARPGPARRSGSTARPGPARRRRRPLDRARRGGGGVRSTGPGAAAAPAVRSPGGRQPPAVRSRPILMNPRPRFCCESDLTLPRGCIRSPTGGRTAPRESNMRRTLIDTAAAIIAAAIAACAGLAHAFLRFTK